MQQQCETHTSPISHLPVVCQVSGHSVSPTVCSPDTHSGAVSHVDTEGSRREKPVGEDGVFTDAAFQERGPAHLYCRCVA